MRVRYSRCPGLHAGVREYVVRTQEKPRGRWAHRGIVFGFGARSSQWAALGDGARAWTRYRSTRAGAVADMLAGRTFLDVAELAGGSRAAAGRQGLFPWRPALRSPPRFAIRPFIG